MPHFFLGGLSWLLTKNGLFLFTGDTYGVKTKYIVADFTYTDVYENIRENLAGMDIGILG